jgi:hypothetical protein
MEAFNSITSFSSRTCLCSISIGIFFQKYDFQYRCGNLLLCRKILTPIFAEIPSRQGKRRRHPELAPITFELPIHHDRRPCPKEHRP